MDSNIQNGLRTIAIPLSGPDGAGEGSGFISYLGKNSIPWEPALKKIADRYKQDGTPLLFPVVTAKSPREQWRQYDGLRHRVNYSLKKLGERIGLDYPLNLTVARHSWESMTKSVSISDIL